MSGTDSPGSGGLWRLQWPHGSAVVRPTAAMLQDVVFHVGGGRSFRPLAMAPWASTGRDDLFGHMRHLGGEFVCLPFGVGGPLERVDAAWRHLGIERTNEPAHGAAANADWRLVAQRPGHLELALDEESPSPVRRLTRILTGDPAAPAIDLQLIVEARCPARISLGLHPIVTLAAPAESLRLDARFGFGLTYPAAVPGGGMAAAVGATFADLAAVPAADGGVIDLSRLPKREPMEDVVQLCDVAGPVEVVFEAERAGLRVDWDRGLLPSCQLWISDRALERPPWEGRFRGLGIEPIASAFDFAHAVSAADNPIAARGVATAVDLDPERPLAIRYRLEAFKA